MFTGGVNGLVGSLLGLFGCSLVPYFLFTRGGMHGGDVKLFAGLGAWLGFYMGVELQFYSMLFAASFGMLLLIRRREFLGSLLRTLQLFAAPFSRKARERVAASSTSLELRIGPAIFLGTFASLATALLEATA